jgi:hypothetical protein
MDKPAVSYKRHRFPAEIIAYAVWLYFCFPPSLRHVEEMLLERGIVVSYERSDVGAKSLGLIMPVACAASDQAATMSGTSTRRRSRSRAKTLAVARRRPGMFSMRSCRSAATPKLPPQLRDAGRPNSCLHQTADITWSLFPTTIPRNQKIWRRRMAHEREPTLDELLNEPIIVKVMKRDGYTPDDIRLLVRQARTRANVTPRAGNGVARHSYLPVSKMLSACCMA